MPFNSNNLYNSAWLYTLILDSSIDRDKLIHKLNQLGIELRPSFCSLSEMPPYKNFRKSLNLKIVICSLKRCFFAFVNYT